MRSLIPLLSISLGTLLPLRSTAQLVPQPSEAPVELSLLAPQTTPNAQNAIATADTWQLNLNIPSLWWAKDQFGDKLLDNWLVHPGDNTTSSRIDLLVNQDWSLLDYVDRYEFVNHFGTVARDYGYNVRVFNYQKQLLATYTCNFATTPQVCRIDNIETAGAGLRRVVENRMEF